MPPLVSIPEAKKASNADIILTMNKLSDILTDRDLNSPDFSTEEVFRKILGHSMFNNPDEIKTPFIITDSIIGVQSTLPRKNSDGTKKNGKHVTSLIQVPGSEPYYSYVEGTETYIESEIVTLRGARSVALHKIIPGMIVSFHHYRVDNGHQERYQIDALRVGYSDNGKAGYEVLPESEALFNMPSINAGTEGVH